MPVVEQLTREQDFRFARTSSHSPEVKKRAGSAPASSPPHPLTESCSLALMRVEDTLPWGTLYGLKSPDTVIDKLKDEERFLMASS